MKKSITTSLIILLCASAFAQDNYVRATLKPDKGQASSLYYTVAGDGAWCWFSDPRAVYHKGCTYTGWIDSAGDIYISKFNHEFNAMQTTLVCKDFEKDDHDSPSIHIDGEGYIYVFFSKHAETEPMHLRKSLKPEDISAFGPDKLLEINDVKKYPEWRNSYTYYSPVSLSAEGGRMYVFWRGMDGKPSYSTSEDGSNWSTGRIFFMPERTYGFRRPYTKYYSDGKDRIHILLTDGHPRNEKENSVYYMCYKDGGFYRADGSFIKGVDDGPVSPQEADKLYDASITGEKAWIWDIAQDKKGRPVVAYVKFPDDNHHIYCYARWTGKRWESETLIDSGKWFPETPEGKVEMEPNYSGGMSIDKEDPCTLYLSVDRNGVFEIEKWTKKGSGWTVEAITKGSAKDNVRPFAVRGAGKGDKLQLMWMEVDNYVHYDLAKDYSPLYYQTSIKTNISKQ